jgi:hypothetical protein
VSDTFEPLRAQGEINRIVGEALDEELDTPSSTGSS